MLVQPMCLVHELPKNHRQKGQHRLGGCREERVFQCAKITKKKINEVAMKMQVGKI